MPRSSTSASASAPPSPLAAAMAKVGDRWTLLVVEALLAGPRRYSAVKAAVPGIASNVLAQRLQQLERDGLVVARAYSDRPPRFTYALTTAGQDLAGALLLLASWGASHTDDAEAPGHRLCGTPLEPRWYCPTCTVPVADPDADELHHI